MASDVFFIVWKLQDYVRLLETLFKHQKLMELFPSTVLELAAMDLPGPIERNVLQNISGLLITDAFTERTGFFLMRNTK